MRVIDVLRELHQKDILIPYIQSTIVNSKTAGWLELYNFYEAKRIAGLGKSDAIKETNNKFRRTRRSVYDVINVCESEVKDNLTRKSSPDKL